MKLVFLPGMDGTARLFAPLLKELHAFSCETFPLPEDSKQDYESLVQWLLPNLPREPFVLVAESFSGPIALLLAHQKIENLRGLVFVATFASPPKKHLLRFVPWLPIRLLLSLPGQQMFQKLFLLGRKQEQALVDFVCQTIESTPADLFKQRLLAISSMKQVEMVSPLSALYIQATRDALISKQHARSFSTLFPTLTCEHVEGPHLLLQTKPVECARLISGFVNSLKNHH